MSGQFNEEDHPRDDHGRFDDGGGGGGGGSNTISEDEKQALKVYTHAGSYPINDYLRNGTLPQDGKYANATPVRDEEDLHNAVRDMDSAMDKASLPNEMNVHRGVDQAAWDKVFKNLKVGDTITDKGFASTSLKKVSSAKLSHFMKIKVPKGAKAIPLDGVVANRTSGELLLKRGTTFKVTGMTKSGATLEVVI